MTRQHIDVIAYEAMLSAANRYMEAADCAYMRAGFTEKKEIISDMMDRLEFYVKGKGSAMDSIYAMMIMTGNCLPQGLVPVANICMCEDAFMMLSFLLSLMSDVRISAEEKSLGEYSGNRYRMYPFALTEAIEKFKEKCEQEVVEEKVNSTAKISEFIAGETKVDVEVIRAVESMAEECPICCELRKVMPKVPF